MITLYQWDERRIYSGSVEADERGALPPRSTPTAPPDLDGEQVAQWRGSGWTVLESRPVAPEPAPAVPQSVGPFEARAALHLAGLLDDVEALVADPATDPLTKMAWERATEFRRDSQMIATMTAVLGWTEQQVDELFIAAGQVRA